MAVFSIWESRFAHAFRLRDEGSVSVPRLVVAVVCLALIGVGVRVSSILTLAVLALMLCGPAAFETATSGEFRRELRARQKPQNTTYSPDCVEEEFCELRLYAVLGSWRGETISCSGELLDWYRRVSQTHRFKHGERGRAPRIRLHRRASSPPVAWPLGAPEAPDARALVAP
jgi:hypothetical protein